MILRVLILLLAASPAQAFSLRDGSAGLELTGTKGSFRYYEETRLNFEIMPSEKVNIFFSVGNRLDRLESWEDVRLLNFPLWSVNIRYMHTRNTWVGIGNRYLSYSPYTVHLESRNENIFSGLIVSYSNARYDLAFDGFAGLHAEERTPVWFDGSYLAADIGYLNKYRINRIQNESPSVWGAFRLSRSWNANFKSDLFYVRENYVLEKPAEGFITYYFFNNSVFQGQFDLNAGRKVILNLRPAVMLKNYAKYNGFGDYYGSGKHKLLVDYEHSEWVPSGEAMLGVERLADAFMLNGRYSVTWRYVDDRYNPIHMDDGRLSEKRGENFLDDILPGEKGLMAALELPLFQGASAGAEYWDFSNITRGHNFWERRYFVKQEWAGRFSMLCMFYDKNGYLRDYGFFGRQKGLVLRADGSLMENLSFQIWFVENPALSQGEHQVFVRTVYRF